VRLSTERRLHARRISLGGEGNALYPVLSGLLLRFVKIFGEGSLLLLKK